MNTLILPGYSLKNKDWVKETSEKLEAGSINVKVWEWKHWVSDEKFDLEYETKDY